MKGIIFTENIDKIMAGTKTQTRRVIKPQPVYLENSGLNWNGHAYGTDGTFQGALRNFSCAALHRPGNIVYVKEAWGKVGYSNTAQYIAYRADGRTLDEIQQEDMGFEWSKAMFMPKSAARTFLRVTAARAERLQDISPEDCHAEGVVDNVCAVCLEHDTCRPRRDVDVFCGHDEQIVERYADLWDKLNAKRDGGAFAWANNPWVWAYTFERVANLAEAGRPAGAYADQPTLRPAT